MSVKTALVVDDSRSSRFALRKFLEAHGCLVDTAESAEEAYLYLRSKRPDVLFLDHLMPGSDGFDALRTLRADPVLRSLPIIICSSNEGSEFIAEARAQGAIDVLPKPPSAEDIAKIIQRVAALATVHETVTEEAVLAPMALMPAPFPPAGAPPLAGPASGGAGSSGKVQPIRVPEVAIERAVMKTLREAMPPNLPQNVQTLQGPPSMFSLETAARLQGVRPDLLREELETRLRRITQDLFVQLAEMKAQLSHVEGSVEARSDHHGLVQAIEDLRERIETLPTAFDSRINQVREELVAAIAAQSGHFEALSQEMLAAASAEAHNVAERVVMNAAVRISEQMAESFLRVLKPAAAAGQN